jgi:HAD superfamily hydrolase (TIGR01549 family)
MPLTNEIKAVFYDLDGTLHADNPPQFGVFCQAAAGLGLTISTEARRKAAPWEYYYFSQSEEILADRNGYPDEIAFWNNFVRRQLVALGATAEQATELGPRLFQYMNEHYHPRDVILPGVEQVLETLRKQGYILGLVTNRDKPHEDQSIEVGLREYFDFWLTADQVDSSKPDKRIFEYALQLAGVEAAQSVYVGDNYFTDVVGSRNAGMKPVLLDLEGVFEQPGCPVIRSHRELLELLEKRLPEP